MGWSMSTGTVKACIVEVHNGYNIHLYPFNNNFENELLPYVTMWNML